jgi:hypothetical protein
MRLSRRVPKGPSPRFTAGKKGGQDLGSGAPNSVAYVSIGVPGYGSGSASGRAGWAAGRRSGPASAWGRAPGRFLIWLVLAPVLFGMGQFGVHGILINRKLHSLYNPGLFAVAFLHWPIGLYYVWYVVVNGLVQWWMWPVAVIVLGAGAFFGVRMPVGHWFRDPNSPYPFSKKEMARFHVQEKLDRLNPQEV